MPTRQAVGSLLALVVSLALVTTLRAADATEARESKLPPRPQDFGLPLDQLNLTNDQKAKVEALWKEYGPQLAESEKKMAAILTDGQRKARQEAEQAARTAGKTRREIREAVESATQATAEQEAKFAELRKETAPLQREIREKILALLTPEQKGKLLGQERSVPGPAAAAKPPAGSPSIQPIESLWYLSPRQFTGDRDADAPLLRTYKQWQSSGVFDAALLLKLPPTFVDSRAFNQRTNAMMKEIGGRFIIATMPVGKEGWESSANQRFAEKLATTGVHYDASNAMSQGEWLETLKDLNADTWAWVLEHGARIPTPEEAARSASEFARFAKAQHKQAVVWLTAEALTHGMERLMQGICDATRSDADFYVWMDLPAETLSAGEPRWRETMSSLLDKILKLTPPQKTVIQWMNNPRWPTGTVEGTKTYISICQAKGINRFAALGVLNQEPWPEFYRALPRKGAAAVKQQQGSPMGAGRATVPAATATRGNVPPGRTTVEFPRGTGHRWMVNGPGGVDQRRGPGNNYWTNAPDVVWVDEKGLHLKIVKRGDQWRCSALGLPEGLGYGKYIYSLSTRVDRLDRNVVIGLFTFNHETFKTDANGELDVEITQWGNQSWPGPQICYTVQPSLGGHRERGRQVDTTSAERTTHVIEWTPRYIEFHSYEGDDESGRQIGHFRFDDTNPPVRFRHPVTGEESDPVVVPNPRGKAHAAINLWLVRGQPPTDPNATDVEIVVSNFRFVPMRDGGQ